MNKQQLTRIGVLLNIVLLIGKGFAGFVTGSTAVISDALNSLLDVFSYTAIHMSVVLQDKEPDANHPFGHRRAEPLAGVIIAVVAAILGATIAKEAVFGFFEGSHQVAFSWFAILFMCFSIVTKLALTIVYRRAWKRTDSLAMRAGAIDSLNDVLASSLALSGLVLGHIWDSSAGLLIGGWVLFSGVRVGLDSVGYLMGKVPNDRVLKRIENVTMGIPGVVNFNDLRAHFVGDRVHVEIHIEVDDTLSLREAHEISIAVRYGLQDLPEIDRAFIHIDPITLKDKGAPQPHNVGKVPS